MTNTEKNILMTCCLKFFEVQTDIAGATKMRKLTITNQVNSLANINARLAETTANIGDMINNPRPHWQSATSIKQEQKAGDNFFIEQPRAENKVNVELVEDPSALLIAEYTTDFLEYSISAQGQTY